VKYNYNTFSSLTVTLFVCIYRGKCNKETKRRIVLRIHYVKEGKRCIRRVIRRRRRCIPNDKVDPHLPEEPTVDNSEFEPEVTATDKPTKPVPVTSSHGCKKAKTRK
jgi:hypothetical protein